MVCYFLEERKKQKKFSGLYILQLRSTSSMDTFQWEDRQQQVPLWAHMIAGSCAGLSEHLSTLPLDNVKTHCQAGSHLSNYEIVKNIYKAGGLSNFYSGTSVLAMGCIPAHAIYFSIYEQAKLRLNCQGQQNHYKFALVGVASALFHDLVMTPTQVLKQRLQLLRSHQGWMHTGQLAKKIYKTQGFISFYRSFGINFLMNVPFNSFIVFFNQKLKFLMGVKHGDHHLNYYLCGGLAGALASIPTTPFDVIKTKLNTQACLTNSCQKKIVCEMLNQKSLQKKNAKKMRKFNFAIHNNIIEKSMLKQSICHEKPVKIKYRNIIDTSKTIYTQQGVKGFFAGLKFRMAIQSVSSAIAWGTYQVFKTVLVGSNFNKAH